MDELKYSYIYWNFRTFVLLVIVSKHQNGKMGYVSVSCVQCLSYINYDKKNPHVIEIGRGFLWHFIGAIACR